jgi:predicted transposase/invertase (TIGR01784 family)
MAKSKINNPHDKFVKEMFADKQMALAFLEAKLPKKLLSIIDLTTFTFMNTTFITKNLNQYFADLIYKFNLKGKKEELFVSLLIENKSVPDEYVLFQIIEYEVLHPDKDLN